MKLLSKPFIIIILYLSSAGYLPAQQQHDDGPHQEKTAEFNPSKFIMEHISDSHEWHLWGHTAIYLPVIVYSKEKGLQVFLSDKISHGHTYNGFTILHEGEYKGKIVEVNEQGEVVAVPLDFSITRNVVSMFISILLLVLLFGSAARFYKKHEKEAPRGIAGFLEPLILFVRDDIAIPNIGKEKHKTFLPYLLSVFFFIWINNIMGLIPFPPFGSNLTGNISFTFTLAVFTFIITQVKGNPQYWKHIFATPGVPVWLLPIMIPVEIIGIFSKPFALMIRLFANITAGHIIVLSLVSLIFIFKTIYLAPVSIAFVLFMDLLELLVAFLQAYVFTLLSALFIGLAVEDHH